MDDYKIIVEQQRVVSILDTFEASIQNLEAQLVQREKQYEYYRNKLLTFELLLQILA
jgi:restriction endonuclease S subunit